MQNTTTLPPPDTPWVISKTVLTDAGLNGEVHLLAPDAEMTVDQASPGPLVFFVSGGSVTVASGLKNFILQTEETLHLAPGSKYALRNRSQRPAKILVLGLPAPRPARVTDDLALPRI